MVFSKKVHCWVKIFVDLRTKKVIATSICTYVWGESMSIPVQISLYVYNCISLCIDVYMSQPTKAILYVILIYFVMHRLSLLFCMYVR